MKYIKIISAIGLMAMTAVLFYAFNAGDFFADGGKILQNPWGIVSLVDLYTGFVLFSAWIIFREKSWNRSAVWIILMMLLGFFTASLYTLITIYQSKGDWRVFWMGKYYYE